MPDYAYEHMPMSRVFNQCMVAVMAAMQAPGQHIWLTREHKADLVVWQQFLKTYNGR